MAKSKGRRLAEWMRSLNASAKVESVDDIFDTDTRVTSFETPARIAVSDTDDIKVATTKAVVDHVDVAIAELADSAPLTLDTLNELAAALGDDPNFATTTANSLGNRLRIDTDAQGLTSTQQTNALTNLGFSTATNSITVDGLTANSATIGDLTVDTDTLVVDATNNRVGIGTANPSFDMDLVRTSDAQLLIQAGTSNVSDVLFGDTDDVNIGRLRYSHTDNSMQFQVNNAERMRIDSSGNVGIGITPENSSGVWRNIQFGGGNLASRANSGVDAMVGTNYLFKTDNSEVYKNGSPASRLFFDSNEMLFQQAASGTAGASISWSEAMRIDSSGNVGIGTNSPSSLLTVDGSIGEKQYSLTGTAIDPDNGTIQYKTLSANTTFTESLSNGEYVTLMIDDGSGYTVTWPTMTWVGGSAPTLETSGYNVIEIWKVNNVVYGAFVGAA